MRPPLHAAPTPCKRSPPPCEQDVMRANVMNERGMKKFGVILAFDVPGGSILVWLHAWSNGRRDGGWRGLVGAGGGWPSGLCSRGAGRAVSLTFAAQPVLGRRRGRNGCWAAGPPARLSCPPLRSAGRPSRPGAGVQQRGLAPLPTRSPPSRAHAPTYCPALEPAARPPALPLPTLSLPAFRKSLPPLSNNHH